MLTNILSHFVLSFSEGFGRVQPYAWGLLGTIAVIEMSLLGLFWKLSDTDARQLIASLVLKLLGIGFFVFILQSYIQVVDVLRDSFLAVGIKAGGSDKTIASFLDPSGIISMGLDVTKPLFEDLFGDTTLQTIKNLFSPFRLAVTLVCALTILMGYFLMALQIFWSLVEFYIVSSIAVILVPFGVSKFTKTYFDRAMNYFILCGARLMMLSFVASIGLAYVSELKLDEDNSLASIFEVLFSVLALALVMWRAPSIASGLLGGFGPSMDASNGFLQPALNAASGFANAASKTARFSGSSATPSQVSTAAQNAAKLNPETGA